MNREQRREITKRLRNRKLSKEEIEMVFSDIENESQKTQVLYEGEKVKLNYSRMVSYPHWEKMNAKYKRWVTKNRDKIFTVEYDPAKPRRDMVQLKEDESEPKWLFWAGDLILQKDLEPMHIESDYEAKLKELDNKFYEIVESLE